jgi:hypothetical protein
MSKNKTKMIQMRAKINLKMKMKNLISQSLKMIIKISKEWEKYASMMKRYRNILKRKVIFKSKEIKLIQK